MFPKCNGFRRILSVWVASLLEFAQSEWSYRNDEAQQQRKLKHEKKVIAPVHSNSYDRPRGTRDDLLRQT